MTPARCVLLVEGQGEVAAAPVLLKRLLKEQGALGALVPDAHGPLRVGGYPGLVKDGASRWRHFLRFAGKHKGAAARLLLLDGDYERDVDGAPFCPCRAAQRLAAVAREEGGGTVYSVAIVFSRQEYESWLLGGAESLAGAPYGGGAWRLPSPLAPPEGDLERAPRGAKELLKRWTGGRYKPDLHQAQLTALVDFDRLRSRTRSFRRLEHAVQQLAAAVQSGGCVVTPADASTSPA